MVGYVLLAPLRLLSCCASGYWYTDVVIGKLVSRFLTNLFDVVPLAITSSAIYCALWDEVVEANSIFYTWIGVIGDNIREQVLDREFDKHYFRSLSWDDRMAMRRGYHPSVWCLSDSDDGDFDPPSPQDVGGYQWGEVGYHSWWAISPILDDVCDSDDA